LKKQLKLTSHFKFQIIFGTLEFNVQGRIMNKFLNRLIESFVKMLLPKINFKLPDFLDRVVAEDAAPIQPTTTRGIFNQPIPIYFNLETNRPKVK
jgi:hypothetical protein